MDNNSDFISVFFTEDTIAITDKNTVKSFPLAWFPRLLRATEEEKNNFTLSPFGIHWEQLDEDLSFEGFDTYEKLAATN